ncbi:hypothetical protein GCM10025783_20140 [Amnibacterium soli]|uniref:DUF308 domain-containing protein n=1 Tax=Amnibacterium soli TaxID=1282736 RepID=A0ABP8Z6R3_9MICO
MSTTTRPARFPVSTPLAVAVRAIVAAGLAIVVTFALDHGDPARFGLLVLGGYLIVQAVVLAVCAPGLAWSRVGRALVLVRALVSLVGGVIALTGVDGGIDVLRPLEALVFLLLGALEIVGGLRRSERADLAGDAVVVGGLQALVGVLLIILNSDPLFAVGVLAAWGAIVAVYLGISAANLRRRAVRA